jgi:hypothetical protein
VANIIIKSDERRSNENRVLREFRKDPDRASTEHREAAEYIAHVSEKFRKEAERP